MFVPVPTAEEMSRWDAGAIALGMAEEVLMENAARCAMDSLRQHWAARGRSLSGASVLLLAGSGNNGGDAFCMARHLLDAGAKPILICTREPEGYRGAASHWLNVAISLGVPVFSADAWEDNAEGIPTRPDIAVDGLLGTGFRGALREREARLVAKFNALGADFVLAVDIPSGLDSRTGRPCPDAVRAHATVSFQAAKPGLLVPEARIFTGLLDVRPIGMPRRVQEEIRPSFRTWLLPAQIPGDRASNISPCALPAGATPATPWNAPAHKGEAGRVIVIGGCADYVGAPCLAGLAALRAGAGLVTVAGPEAVLNAVRFSMPALTTQGIGADSWNKDAAPALAPALASAKSVLRKLISALVMIVSIKILDRHISLSVGHSAAVNVFTALSSECAANLFGHDVCTGCHRTCKSLVLFLKRSIRTNVTCNTAIAISLAKHFDILLVKLALCAFVHTALACRHFVIANQRGAAAYDKSSGSAFLSCASIFSLHGASSFSSLFLHINYKLKLLRNA